MSSPDERQGDAHATCSSYYCDVGPKHSVPCDKPNMHRTKVLEVPLSDHSAIETHEDGGSDSDVLPSQREPNYPNNPIKDTSTDSALIPANSNMEVLATTPRTEEERQQVISV